MDTDRKGPALRKLYYSIGEVSELTGVPAHVLRYWESEFPQLRPKKSRAGNRTYQEKDLEVLQQIRTLLYEQKFTIAGARAQLSGIKGGGGDENGNGNGTTVIEEVRQGLQEILNLLDDK